MVWIQYMITFTSFTTPHTYDFISFLTYTSTSVTFRNILASQSSVLNNKFNMLLIQNCNKQIKSLQNLTLIIIFWPIFINTFIQRINSFKKGDFSLMTRLAINEWCCKALLVRGCSLSWPSSSL